MEGQKGDRNPLLPEFLSNPSIHIDHHHVIPSAAQCSSDCSPTLQGDIPLAGTPSQQHTDPLCGQWRHTQSLPTIRTSSSKSIPFSSCTRLPARRTRVKTSC